MGEKLGFMTVLLIFSVFFIPTILYTFSSHVEGSRLLNASTEIQQLVSSEGGMTPKVENAINEFEKQGIDIVIRDEDGNRLVGKADVGEKLTIDYKYKNFETSNSVIILKR